MSTSTFHTPRPPTLDVELQSGSLTVVTCDQTDTTVELRSNRDESEWLDEAAVHQRNDTVVVHGPRSTGLRRRNRVDIDATITAPSGSRLEVRLGSAAFCADGEIGGGQLDLGSGDARLTGCTGSLRLRSGSGTVTIDAVDGSLVVAAGSGDVTIGRVTGSIDVKVGSGDVRLDAVAGELRLITGSGDIEIGESSATVAAKSGSGDVRVGRVVEGEVDATSASGDVKVGVQDGTAAWLDVHSQTGSAVCDLESSDGPDDNCRQARLRLSSISGDVTVSRA